MTRLFIYTTPFRNAWKAMGLNDTDLVQLEEAFLENPQKGDVAVREALINAIVEFFDTYMSVEYLIAQEDTEEIGIDEKVGSIVPGSMPVKRKGCRSIKFRICLRNSMKRYMIIVILLS